MQLIGWIITYFVLRGDDPKRVRNCLYLWLVFATVGIVMDVAFWSQADTISCDFSWFDE